MNRTIIHMIFFIIISTMVYGCSTCNRLNRNAMDVRVTNDPNVVKDCEYIQSISKKEMNFLSGLNYDTLESCTNDLRNQTANLGGNIFYIVTQNGNPAYVYMKGDVYKCK